MRALASELTSTIEAFGSVYLLRDGEFLTKTYITKFCTFGSWAGFFVYVPFDIPIIKAVFVDVGGQRCLACVTVSESPFVAVPTLFECAPSRANVFFAVYFGSVHDGLCKALSCQRTFSYSASAVACSFSVFTLMFVRFSHQLVVMALDDCFHVFHAAIGKL